MLIGLGTLTMKIEVEVVVKLLQASQGFLDVNAQIISCLDFVPYSSAQYRYTQAHTITPLYHSIAYFLLFSTYGHQNSHQILLNLVAK